MIYSILTFAVAGAGIVALLLWRYLDTRADRRVRRQLLRRAGAPGPAFDPGELTGLPERARAWFGYSIAPGTPLVSVLEIEMTGRIGLGTRETPGYAAMRARQILAPPFGLLWSVRTAAFSGSDAVTPEASWTRMWLFHLAPLVRASGADHHRSAFGRLVCEGAFWMPSSLLPGEHVRWESVSDDVVRASVELGGFSQSVDLTVDADGRPSAVVMQRWSNANAEKVWREQPFGGYLSNFRDFGGYRLPTHVEGGNHFGTPEYFPFFEADVTSFRFPQLAGKRSA